jgi:hypothetical protein
LTITNANLQKLQYISLITSDIQTQVTTLSTNSVLLTSNNIFTGITNTFNNNVKLYGSLLISDTLIIPQQTLFKLEYLENLGGNIQSQFTNVNSNITTNTNNITTNTNNITTNTNNITTNTNNITTNTNSINTAKTNITNNTNSINTANTNITNNTNKITTLENKTQGLSWVGMITGVTGILATSDITFNNRINDVTVSVFNY